MNILYKSVNRLADSLCSVLSWPHRLARYFLKGLVKSRRKAAANTVQVSRRLADCLCSVMSRYFIK